MNLWVVGQLLENDKHSWQVVGIFDSKEKADAACVTTDHFFGPLELNKNVGEPVVDWPDSVYPRIENGK